jgi:hypothetical protein
MKLPHRNYDKKEIWAVKYQLFDYLPILGWRDFLAWGLATPYSPIRVWLNLRRFVPPGLRHPGALSSAFVTAELHHAYI